MTPKVLEAALYADDLNAAERFYCDVLGFEVLVRAPGRHVFFRLNGAVLLVFNPAATSEPPAPGARFPFPLHGARGAGHVCFAATEKQIEFWRKKLTAAGVDIEADFRWPSPDNEPGGRSIYFRDPAGNSVEFAEPRIWGF